MSTVQHQRQDQENSGDNLHGDGPPRGHEENVGDSPTPRTAFVGPLLADFLDSSQLFARLVVCLRSVAPWNAGSDRDFEREVESPRMDGGRCFAL